VSLNKQVYMKKLKRISIHLYIWIIQKDIQASVRQQELGQIGGNKNENKAIN